MAWTILKIGGMNFFQEWFFWNIYWYYSIHYKDERILKKLPRSREDRGSFKHLLI
ncbi:hypothetical protein SAMN05660236_5493 [Ohtaekwangia koreensis]|uniref:Uncharacterized protein n=1 Tax=Ohtaekwangia koreensis TaxID=688867 RepID=A0A1T5MIH4_9BACT|nr:hypothetical protein SAMN05660236_5493 [Ohtaekwangia koreensis]